MAKEVFFNMLRTFSWGRTTFLFSLNWGNGGNSSAARPLILKNDAPEAIDVVFFSSTSSSISGLLSSRAMPKSFFTGIVVEPGLETLASTLHEIVTSRSVAVSSRRLSPALRRTFERIGSVVRELTTLWTACSPSSN